MGRRYMFEVVATLSDSWRSPASESVSADLRIQELGWLAAWLGCLAADCLAGCLSCLAGRKASLLGGGSLDKMSHLIKHIPNEPGLRSADHNLPAS